MVELDVDRGSRVGASGHEATWISLSLLGGLFFHPFTLC